MLTRRDMMGAAAMAGATGLAAPAAALPGAPEGLEAAVLRNRAALRAILNGDPKPFQALFADRDDIVLGNPFGPYARGTAAVALTLTNAAARYRDGDVVSVETLASYATDTLACFVEIEHDRAKVGGGSDPVDFTIRVTSVYERIDGQWRLVHRHADPITTPRSVESLTQK